LDHRYRKRRLRKPTQKAETAEIRVWRGTQNNSPNHIDANDLVHRFEASADYHPAPGLEKIQASVLSINFADDELNPPELGIVDRAKQRVRNGQLVLIPASSQTHHDRFPSKSAVSP
jgi:homoserine acetyltransferase